MRFFFFWVMMFSHTIADLYLFCLFPKRNAVLATIDMLNNNSQTQVFSGNTTVPTTSTF